MGKTVNARSDDELPILHPHQKPIKRWKQVLAECVGTCIFAFITETAAVGISDAPLPHNPTLDTLVGGLANGFTLVGIIYSLGPVSGAHFNPAVTVGAMIAKQVTLLQGLFYILAQLAGGIIGTSFVLLVHPDARAGVNNSLGRFALGDISWGNGLFIEAFTTFILVFVVFCVVLNPHVTVEDAKTGNIAPLFAPIAVGFTVAGNILSAGALTGGCMNPARALGPMVLTANFDDAQVYLAGPIIGGILASIFQRIVFGRDPYFRNYD